MACFWPNSPWCVLLGPRCSGVECVLLLTWYCEWTRLCPLLTQSLALHYRRSHLSYALLFYFFFTPISGFTTGVDSLKLPPIYYSTDDLLNFILFYFFHGCLFITCEAVVLIYLYSVWVEQPSDIIYDKCSLIVFEDRRWKYSPHPQTPPPTHLPSEARDVIMCEYIFTRETWLVLFLWGSLFYVEHCWLCSLRVLVFVKDHIYFTIFVDKKNPKLFDFDCIFLFE